MAPSTSIISGAQTVVYINGKPFANVSRFSFQTAMPHKEIHGIDTLLPLDFVPGPLSYSASMSMYRLRRLGGIEGEGLAPSWGAATRGKYFSLILMDRAAQDILFEGHYNLVTQQSWDIATKQIMAGSINFVGKFYDNGWESPTG